MPKSLLHIALLLLLPAISFGQDGGIMPDVNGGTWTSARLQYQPNKYFRFNVEQQLRVGPKLAQFDRTFTELSTRFTPVKNFDVDLGYRYLFRTNTTGLLTEQQRLQRWHFRAGYTFELDRLSFQVRVQWQRRRELLRNTNKYLGDIRKYWRFRWVLGYNFKKWKLDPELGTELFIAGTERPRGQYSRMRVALGTSYKLDKRHRIGIRYLFDRELVDWNPELWHVLSLQYTYRIKRKKKRPQATSNE